MFAHSFSSAHLWSPSLSLSLMAASGAAPRFDFVPPQCRRMHKDSLKGLFFTLISLALTSSVLFFVYSFSSLKLDYIHQHQEGRLIHPTKAIIHHEEPQQVVKSQPLISQELFNLHHQEQVVLPESAFREPAEEIASTLPFDDETPWPRGSGTEDHELGSFGKVFSLSFSSLICL